MENQNEPRNLDLEQSFPVENSTRKSKVRSEHDNKSGEPSDKVYDQKSWEEFCKNSSNMTDEERQQEFVKHVVGNPFAKKVIGKGGPDKNGIEIGKAPWCKIVAVVETILLVASFVGIFYVVAQLTEATAIFFASQR